MSVEVYTYIVNDLPIVVIDNLYVSEEIEKMMYEAKFWCDKDKLKTPEETGSAIDISRQQILKQNKSIFLNDKFTNPLDSDIVSIINDKLFDKEVINNLSQINGFFDYLNICNVVGVQLSYYENSDHYKPHHDVALLTCITWINDEPQMFMGGNLKIGDLEIEYKNNRTILIPSILPHEVTKVEMPEENLNKKLGRFSISAFLKSR